MLAIATERAEVVKAMKWVPPKAMAVSAAAELELGSFPPRSEAPRASGNVVPAGPELKVEPVNFLFKVLKLAKCGAVVNRAGPRPNGGIKETLERRLVARRGQFWKNRPKHVANSLSGGAAEGFNLGAAHGL